MYELAMILAVIFQVVKDLQKVSKGLDTAMKSMDIQKVCDF